MDDLDRLYHRLLDAVRESAPQLRERRFRLGDIPQHLLPYRLHRRELGFDSVQQYEGALARLAAGERGYLSADATVQQAFRRAVDGGDVPLEQALRLHGDALVALTPEARHRPDTPTTAAPAVAPPPAAPATADVSAAAAGTVAAGTAAAAAGGLVIPIVRVEEADSASGAPAAVVAEPAQGPPDTLPPASGSTAGTPPVDPPAAPPPAAPPPAAPPGAAPPSPPDAMPFPVRSATPVVGGTCRNCGRPLPADRGVTFCPYCGENLTIRRCPACSTELEAGWRFCITCGREVDEPTAAPSGGAAANG